MDRILLGHGGGGILMHKLIREFFVPEFGMNSLGDSAIIDSLNSGRLAFTTDSYVVSPIFFPGGNIGELAVYGTVNDLAMAGASPICLSAGFIIEEGFLIEDLKKILSSMSEAAKRADVKIVAGDTKVVNKGKGDGIYINTSGIGVLSVGIDISPSNIKAGDKIIVSGMIGNHGVAVMAERNGLSFDPPVVSDTAPLNHLVIKMLRYGGVNAMRDPTRGGLATALKEIAVESGFCLEIAEESVPIAKGVRGASELLGLDPLYIANEGVFVAVVNKEAAEPLLEIIKSDFLGKDASIIGEVSVSPEKKVLLKTKLGGRRLLEMLSGEQLPRIC